MTAEIAVMNKEAVALAADSAATLDTGQGAKISMVNKIFGLSTHHPVGIMIYGSAAFLGVPWETIIKLYRDELGRSEFDSLDGYVEHFLEFFKTHPEFFSEEQQARHVRHTTQVYLYQLRQDVVDQVEEHLEHHGSITDADVKRLVRETIDRHRAWWEGGEVAPGFPRNYRDRLRREYGNLLDEEVRDAFENLPLTKRSREKLEDILIAHLVKFVPQHRHPDTSGVVIAGYGRHEIFPRLRSLSFEGMVAGHLKCVAVPEEAADVSHDNRSTISAFAQRDMVYLFMEGVDSAYLELTDDIVRAVVRDVPASVINNDSRISEADRKRLKAALGKASDEVMENYGDVLQEARRQRFAMPVIEAVATLPKGDLATMAETLVNLTAFKRRVSLSAETVGGPIDVAVISKGDGFIWVKRKHYFEPELNPHFLARYSRS